MSLATGHSRLTHLYELAGVACLNIAHRGASGHAPENTLPAFELAVKQGAHMFELDVHLSADGHVVVHHDDDVLRCSDARQRFPGRASYFISDFSLAELQTLDAGSQHAGAAATKLPTLDEVLALAKSAKRFVNIELKTIPRLYRALVPRVFESLDRLDMRGQVLISSFDHQALLEVRAHCERVATGVLCSGRLARVPEYLALLDADAYHPSCWSTCDSMGLHAVDSALDMTTIDALRRAGKHINVWTCNEPDQMNKLLVAGVTGIVTDYPDRLAKLI
jgi:glycerophosphoryl diester phosphodiesterase